MWGRGAGCLRREMWGQSILGFSNISSSFLPQGLCICWPFCLELKKIFFSQFYWDVIDMTCVCAQLCLTLCDPMDCSRPGSSVHRIFQARILEWVAIPSCRRSPWPRDWTHISFVSCIGRQFLYCWPSWEAVSGTLFHTSCFFFWLLGFSFNMRDFCWGAWTLLLCHMGSVVVAQVLSCPVACGILVPQPGIWDLSSWTRNQTCVPCIQGGFLTSGPPRKFLHTSFYGWLFLVSSNITSLGRLSLTIHLN